MTYELKLSLDGFDEAGSSLDALLSKVNQLGSVSNIDFSMDAAIDKMNLEQSAKKSGKESGSEYAKAFAIELSQIKKVLAEELVTLDPKKISFAMSNASAKVKDLVDSNFDAGEIPKNNALKYAAGLDKIVLNKSPKLEKPNWKKILMGVVLGFSNPYIGSRIISDEMGKHGNESGGLFGKGGIGGFSNVFSAFKLFKFSVDTFHIASEKILKAADESAKIYSKALNNGLGIGLNVKRSLLSSVLEVDENDVLKFGTQLSYLAPKLEYATKILTETNPAMTQIAWSFRILMIDIEAAFSNIASKIAPDLIEFINILDWFVKHIGSLAQFLRESIERAFPLLKIVDFAASSILNIEKKAMQPIPSPQSFMKQLPASSWEKMGLIVGGGNQNYAKDTAKNTKAISSGIKAIYDKMNQKSGGDYFGMSPHTANA